MATGLGGGQTVLSEHWFLLMLVSLILFFFIFLLAYIVASGAHGQIRARHSIGGFSRFPKSFQNRLSTEETPRKFNSILFLVQLFAATGPVTGGTYF